MENGKVSTACKHRIYKYVNLGKKSNNKIMLIIGGNYVNQYLNGFYQPNPCKNIKSLA